MVYHNGLSTKTKCHYEGRGTTSTAHAPLIRDTITSWLAADATTTFYFGKSRYDYGLTGLTPFDAPGGHGFTLLFSSTRYTSIHNFSYQITLFFPKTFRPRFMQEKTSQSSMYTANLYPSKLRGLGITGSLQGKPALSMKKGCKNHKETLCMLWINPVVFTDCG